MRNGLEDLSVLIVGYRRAENILNILNICQNSGILNIFVSIDGPKTNSIQGELDNKKVRKTIDNFESTFVGNLTIHFRDSNVGCAASVMTSCDWFFAQSEYGVVLEDDCIPSEAFFLFAKNMEAIIVNDAGIWLACGTQFAPRELINNSAIISQYALTWGWATSKVKWLEIKRSIFENSQLKGLKNDNLGFIEKVYWKAGARRAYQGFTDVWDTVLVYQMRIENRYAVLPPENLITNIGNDFAATHTHEISDFLNRNVGSYFGNEEISYSDEVDVWLKNNVYQISFRHLVSTKIRYLLDLFNINRRNNAGLLNRWNDSEIMND